MFQRQILFNLINFIIWNISANTENTRRKKERKKEKNKFRYVIKRSSLNNGKFWDRCFLNGTNHKWLVYAKAGVLNTRHTKWFSLTSGRTIVVTKTSLKLCNLSLNTSALHSRLTNEHLQSVVRLAKFLTEYKIEGYYKTFPTKL